MSRTLSRSTWSTCAVLASASMVLSHAPAAAASPAVVVTTKTTVNYRCLFPLVGVQPIAVGWTLRVPQLIRSGESVAYEAKSTLPQLLTVASLDGTLDAGMDLAVSGGSTRRFPVALGAVTFAAPALTPSLDFTASTQAPLEFTEVGGADLQAATLHFNLRARAASGATVRLRPLTTDIDGKPVTDSDGLADTFDVSCKADPAPVTVGSTALMEGAAVLDTTPPTAPTEVELQAADLTPTSVNLRWGASTDEVGGSGLKEYVIRYEDGPAGGVRVPAGTASKLITDLSTDTEYRFAVTAVDYAGNESAELLLPVATFHFDPCWVFANCPQPLAPIAPAAVAVTETSARIQWTAPRDENIAGYRVDVVGLQAPRPESTAETRVDLTGLKPGTAYTAKVTSISKDTTAPPSEPASVTFTTLAPVCGAPCGGGLPKPTGLRAADVGVTTVDLAWDKSSVPEAPEVKYDVYSGTVKLGTTSATAFRVSGLNSGTAYTFRVQAVEIGGLTSEFSDNLPVTTHNPVPETRHYSYSVTGTTVLKTLAKGSLPLKGGVEADLGSVSGAFSADLTLANTSGRLIAGGFLPLTAKVGFAPSGKTTGQLTGGVLQTKSWVRIKVLEVKLFGAIPLAGGNSCQTRQLSEIALTSGAAFDPSAGGTLAGTFKISDLNGCGVLNGLVSPLTAGAGNTISINLAPKGS